MPFIESISVWLHSIASIVFFGHYLLFALIYLPALSEGDHGPELAAISKKSRSWLYLSMLVFLITGLYLMFADPNYLGFGNFGNVWGIVMVVKHILVLAMIGMGFWFNAIMRVGPAMLSNSRADQAVARFRQYVNMMAGTGTLVLLLTAIAQVQ